jgi:adenylate kinase
MNILIVGAQGSGKGTQAELLTKALGIRHIASGDLFRQALQEDTPLGLKAKAYIERGELVPDELTLEIVLQHISLADCLVGFLLDGFPRTVSQANALDRTLDRIGQQIDLALYLEVSRDALLDRLSGRRICRAHQHVYHLTTRPPKITGICDIDGSELYQRTDDRGEAVNKRLDIFFNETIQLLDYYGKQDKLVTVDGSRNIDVVHQDIMHILVDCYHYKKISLGQLVSPVTQAIPQD